MLSIQRKTTEKSIQIKDLFRDLSIDVIPENEVENNFDIKIKTPAGYRKIDGFRTTEPLRTVNIELENGMTLSGAEKHRIKDGIFSADINELTDIEYVRRNMINSLDIPGKGWIFLEDLVEENLIEVDGGFSRVASVEGNPEKEILFDLQVDEVHQFYSNGILSHNSHFLVNVGAHALKMGKNIIHYTFELSETAVGRRYDSYLCDIDSNEIIKNKDDVLKKYEDMELGKLIIKEYPTGSASVITLKNHLDRLLLRGFVPGMIVIDYADIMRSTRKYDALRHELKLVYEELRNLASERNIPIWTASQANRDSAKSDVVELENMSEAYGKAMVADVVLSLSRKSHEKAGGYGRLFVAKNRAGRDGLLWPVHIDTARSKIRVLQDAEVDALQETESNFKNNMKALLTQKWKEVKESAPVGGSGDNEDG